MDISFRNSKLKKQCNERVAAIRDFGERIARKLFIRLNELRSAKNLAMVSTITPTRCHYVGNIRKECWSVDLEQPFRLLFKVANEPLPLLPDGGIDKEKVDSIIIWEVEDYHGKKK